MSLKLNELIKILDNMYDELLIYDNNYNILYINNACKRHYGVPKEKFLDKSFFEAMQKYWYEPAVLPVVYRDKQTFTSISKTQIGVEITTIAVPIFDDNDELEYVVMNVRDEINYNNLYNNRTNMYDIAESINTEGIIAVSDKMKKLNSDISRIASIDTTCIIYGETGTGKSMFAKRIHEMGARADKPFIYVNCAAIPENLIESELFGYVKGAFTGAATNGKDGLIKAADTGTLFLDEIGELNYSIQAKILHFLQEKEFTPVGGVKPVKVNVRILSATNRNLGLMVKNNQFRQDLFYRLSVIEITVPPLRERAEDISALLYSNLNDFCTKYKVTHELTPEAENVLLNYDYPGNVRELIHIVERLVAMSESVMITEASLPKNLFNITGSYNKKDTIIDAFEGSYENLMENFEKELILQKYKEYPSSRKLATALNITQSKANRLIKKYINT